MNYKFINIIELFKYKHLDFVLYKELVFHITPRYDNTEDLLEKICGNIKVRFSETDEHNRYGVKCD